MAGNIYFGAVKYALKALEMFNASHTIYNTVPRVDQKELYEIARHKEMLG